MPLTAAVALLATEETPVVQAIDHYLAIYPKLDSRGNRVDAVGFLYVLFRSYDDRVDAMVACVPLSVNYADPEELAPFVSQMFLTGRRILPDHAASIFPQVLGMVYRP